MLNQTLELKCQADGVPMPTLNWQFDGQTFATSHGEAMIALNRTESEFLLSEGVAKLKIAKVSSQDQGRYTCLAVNKAGKSEADIFVQVMGKSNLFKDPLTKKNFQNLLVFMLPLNMFELFKAKNCRCIVKS